MRPAPPIITLTSDFGLVDSYVAEMKAALLRHAPAAALIDITHAVPPQDILSGSFLLWRALPAFPKGTVHLCVVDPGVGSHRRLLCANLSGQIVVCPDNGLITLAVRGGLQAGPLYYELDYHPGQSSNTFHGRDILAPVAGMISSGTPVDSLGHRIDDPVLLDAHIAASPIDECTILHIDHFGNAITNIPLSLTFALDKRTLWIGDMPLGPIRDTYSDTAPGEPLLLIGSAGLVEIAIRNGSAARHFSLHPGQSLPVR